MEYKHGMGERLRKVSNAILNTGIFDEFIRQLAQPRAAAAAPYRTLPQQRPKRRSRLKGPKSN